MVFVTIKDRPAYGNIVVRLGSDSLIMRTDHLLGLKENVIMGNLIPAGTGITSAAVGAYLWLLSEGDLDVGPCDLGGLRMTCTRKIGPQRRPSPRTSSRSREPVGDRHGLVVRP